MPGRRSTSGGGAGEESAPPVSVPWAYVLPFLLGLAGGGTSRVAEYVEGDPAIARIESDATAARAERTELKIEIVGMRADVAALRDSIGEIRSIEEAAHPRVGLPDAHEVRYHGEDDPRPPR